MSHDKQMPRIRVAAIIVRGDSLLLVRHEKDGHSYWLLPGGGVDFGEPLDKALQRELREEASVDIRVKDLIFASDSISPDGDRHIVNLYFAAEILNGEAALGTDPRIVELRYVPVAELAALTLYPDIRDELAQAIRDGFSGAAPYLGALWREEPCESPS